MKTFSTSSLPERPTALSASDFPSRGSRLVNRFFVEQKRRVKIVVFDESIIVRSASRAEYQHDASGLRYRSRLDQSKGGTAPIVRSASGVGRKALADDSTKRLGRIRESAGSAPLHDSVLMSEHDGPGDARDRRGDREIARVEPAREVGRARPRAGRIGAGFDHDRPGPSPLPGVDAPAPGATGS